ncbi:MAG TPA: P27 family phage terminase small subunit [Phycisphaerae bacterium]|nr:P27 family phage terminase small subunit [Phycisphaerae bacterium]
MKQKSEQKAPKHLKAPTRKWWESVVSEYELESHHVRLLTLAGESWDRGVQAREALAEHGLTFEDRHGAVKARPEVAIERDSRIAFARLLRELALDVNTPDETRAPGIVGKAFLKR